MNLQDVTSPMETPRRGIPVMDEDRSHADVSWDDARPNTLDLYDGGNAVALRITFPAKQMASQRKRENKMSELLELYTREGEVFIRRWVLCDRADVVDRLASAKAKGLTKETALFKIATEHRP